MSIGTLSIKQIFEYLYTIEDIKEIDAIRMLEIRRGLQMEFGPIVTTFDYDTNAITGLFKAILEKSKTTQNFLSMESEEMLNAIGINPSSQFHYHTRDWKNDILSVLEKIPLGELLNKNVVAAIEILIPSEDHLMLS